MRKADPFVGLTEHPLDEARRIVVAINYSPEPREVALDFAAPWTAGEVWRGHGEMFKAPETAQVWLPSNDAAVFIAQKTAR